MAPVTFVGAGPGAPDLITVRGLRALRAADVVIWAGSLVNPELLRECRPSCETHDSARLTLEDVIGLMRRAVADGRRVVRLHTGDPSLFGAIREQMDALDALGIAYEVVPGVSSMGGAAAALRCEYTLPGVSQTVIVTRAAGRTPVPRGQSLRELAAHGATLVIFLSAGLAASVREELLAAGLDPRTPVAVVRRATWPDEAILRTDVDGLARAMAARGIDRTALIIVGGCVDPLRAPADGVAATSGVDCPPQTAGYERSRLYDPAFATGYRPARPAGSPDDGQGVTA